MRSPLTRARLNDVLSRLGHAARGPGNIYLTGGATGLLLGWRDTTVDLDLRLDPEPPGIFDAIARIKDSFDVNIELASPADFLPEVPGWRERSIPIVQHGEVRFLHYDPLAQALAKLERGHQRDLDDVREMHRAGLFRPGDLSGALEAIEPLLPRFPAIDPRSLRRRVARMVDELAP